MTMNKTTTRDTLEDYPDQAMSQEIAKQIEEKDKEIKVLKGKIKDGELKFYSFGFKFLFIFVLADIIAKFIVSLITYQIMYG